MRILLGGGVAHMNEAPGDGIAWIKRFTEGTIELDIRGKDAFQQSFVGMAYHGIDDSTPILRGSCMPCSMWRRRCTTGRS